MDKNKQPHEQMTDKNNNLSSAQEVLYQKDFNKADKAIEQEENDNKSKDN
ncbi:YfhE family protein [Sporosarcina sp. OR05]